MKLVRGERLAVVVVSVSFKAVKQGGELQGYQDCKARTTFEYSCQREVDDALGQEAGCYVSFAP